MYHGDQDRTDRRRNNRTLMGLGGLGSGEILTGMRRGIGW